MKPKMILCIMMLASPLAFADTFRMIKDGQEYLCSSTSTGTPGGAIACADKAYAGPFSRDEAMRLCQGAKSVSTAECAIKAYAGPFSRDESIQLCAGDSSVENANCAIKAYAGPYSREEAIRLCKTNANLMLRSLKIIEQSRDAQIKVQLLKSVNPSLRD